MAAREMRDGDSAPHPEEMKSTVDVRMGTLVSIKATARATPAGLISAAILMSAILIPIVFLARMRAGRVVR